MKFDYKSNINSNREAIVNFAFNHFQATFISVMNGKDTYHKRDQFGYAHLRFTQICRFDKAMNAVKLDPTKYKDYYIYYTTSTTTDKTSCMDQKVKEDLSDRCFNVADDVLFAPEGRKYSLCFLIDLGGYFAIVNKKDAQKYICKIGKYNGKKVDTVRIPNHCFYKKETNSKFREAIGEENFMKIASFDAKYIQNVTYSKYRNRYGFTKVEGYKNGKLVTVKYYVSSGEVKDDFEAHGLKYSTVYFKKLTKEHRSLKKGDVEYKFSKVDNIQDSSSLPDSIEDATAGCISNHYNLINNNNNNINYYNKNVMIRYTKPHCGLHTKVEESKVENACEMYKDLA